MVINAYFDASYFESRKGARLGIAIKDANTDRNIIIQTKGLTGCNNSVEAEFLSLVYLVEILNQQQSQGIIPLYSTIYIHGDCLAVIEYVNSVNGLKCIKNCDYEKFNCAYKSLKDNNVVSINWVKRKENMAEKALANFRASMVYYKLKRKVQMMKQRL